MKSVVLFAAALVGLATAQTYDWGDDKDGDDPPTQAFCRRVKAMQFPAADRPPAQVAAGLKGCDAESLYYGIGMKADPVRARHCAFTEFGTNEDNSFYGARVMLMTIYANGSGVPRNLDLATHLACGMEDAAPAEHESRVKSLQEMKALGARAAVFDVCDDTTSGLSQGYCAAHTQDIAQSMRKVEYAAIAAKLTPPQKMAFAALEKARDEFATARGEQETDISGSGRVTFIIESEEGAAENFIKLLRRLEAGQGAPAAPRVTLAAADKALNDAYRGVQTTADFDYGTVKKTDIRDTQRVWIRYRDAWLAFAKARYPAVPQDKLAAALTDERTQQLIEFLGGG